MNTAAALHVPRNLRVASPLVVAQHIAVHVIRAKMAWYSQHLQSEAVLKGEKTTAYA